MKDNGPVKDSGLRIHGAVFLAPLAFLSSVSATEGFIHCILPSPFGPIRPLLWPLHFLVSLRVMISGSLFHLSPNK